MRILATSCSAQALTDIQTLLADGTPGDSLRLAPCGGPRPDLGQLDVSQVDLLIIESISPTDGDMDAIEKFTRSNPGLAVVLVCETRTPELLLRAMRADVRAVLPSPVTRADLNETIDRARSRLGVRSASAPRAKIIAFLPAKGGSGATFISTNLGFALADKFQKRVLLIDLDFQFGDACCFVTNKTCEPSVAGVMKQAFRLDANVLASSCVQVAPLYWLLPSPSDPEQAIGLSADDIERVLEVASAHYDFVLLDMGRVSDSVSIRAMDRADQVVLVIQPMVPHVRDGMRQLGLFRSLGYSDHKVQVLANRADTATQLDIKSIEKTLNAKVHWSLPNDFVNCSASVNLGDPVSHLAPDSPMARALIQMGAELCGVELDQPSWFGRLFHHAPAVHGIEAKE